MHGLGKRITVDAILPGRERVCLIDLDWDLHWQRSYSFKDPVSLPAGTRIVVTGHYDNTADNPKNPNSPPVDVKRGRKSYQEMLFATLTLTRDAQRMRPSAPALAAVRVDGARLVADGTGFVRGAQIEVDGHLLADCRPAARGTLCTSAADWTSAVPVGVPVRVAVVNPDGGRTAETVFVRE
jgi:hypothetical protein